VVCLSVIRCNSNPLHLRGVGGEVRLIPRPNQRTLYADTCSRTKSANVRGLPPVLYADSVRCRADRMGKPWDLDVFTYSRHTLLFPSVGCAETSIMNYHYSLRNSPEKCSSQRLDCGPHEQGRRERVRASVEKRTFPSQQVRTG